MIREDEVYREDLLALLEDTSHQGNLENPSHSFRQVNSLCGDEVNLALQVKDGEIEKCLYSSKGCALSQISAIYLAEKVEGKKVDEVRYMNPEALLEALYINPAPARMKCVLLSLEALKSALNPI